MISLDSPDWTQLRHAYGDASDIPALLRQLETMPAAEGNSEPWFSLWSALAHQGDVYTASFAAVPYVVDALATSPSSASYTYFQFPAWVEICRQRHDLTVPEELSSSYFKALEMLGHLVCAAAASDWDFDFLRIALSAMAISKGSALIAETLMELDKVSAEEFLLPRR
jgi:hypothetical protein